MAFFEQLSLDTETENFLGEAFHACPDFPLSLVFPAIASEDSVCITMSAAIFVSGIDIDDIAIDDNENIIETRSPRGLSEWAALYNDDSGSDDLFLLEKPTSMSQLPVDATTKACASLASAPLLASAPSCAAIQLSLAQTASPRSSPSKSLASTIKSQQRLPVARAIPKDGIATIKARRDKAKVDVMMREMATRMHSVDKNMVTKFRRTFDSETRVNVADNLQEEKKIRNRASVQRCREKKSKYYEHMEEERISLLRENSLLANAIHEATNCYRRTHGM
jgi:hypothetical protein